MANNDRLTTKKFFAEVETRGKITSDTIFDTLLDLDLTKEQFRKLSETNAKHFTRQRYRCFYPLIVYVIILVICWMSDLLTHWLVHAFIVIAGIYLGCGLIVVIGQYIRQNKLHKAEEEFKRYTSIITTPKPTFYD